MANLRNEGSAATEVSKLDKILKFYLNMTIGEKVSYLKGLAEGLKTEDKIVNGILDVLADIAENLAEVDEELDDVASVMTDMEESLADIEDDLYGDEDDDYYDDIEDDIADMYETVCPNCGNAIRFDYEQANAGGMDCPNCGKRLEFVLDEDDSEEL